MKRISRVILLLFFVFSAASLFAQDFAKKWVKYENNPVLGGELGTCFDVSLMQEDGVFKMWFSWRPKKSIAYVESVDGINWTEPKIVLSPCSTGWEDNINRCASFVAATSIICGIRVKRTTVLGSVLRRAPTGSSGRASPTSPSFRRKKSGRKSR